MVKRIKLKIDSRDDLPLLASLMQDAAALKSDLFFDAKARQFIIMANRFCWEDKRPWWQRGLFAKKHPGERVHTALHINTVQSVQSKGFDNLPADAVLSLLHIDAVDTGENDAQQLILTFAAGISAGANPEISPEINAEISAGVSVRLTVECIEIFLTDRGERFEALARPDHTKTYDDGETDMPFDSAPSTQSDKI